MTSKISTTEKVDIFNVKQEVCDVERLIDTNVILKDKESDGGNCKKNQRHKMKASPLPRTANLTGSPRRSQGVSTTKQTATRQRGSDDDSEGASDIRIEKDKIVIKINLKNLKKKRKKRKRKKYKSRTSSRDNVAKKSKKIYSKVSVNIENNVNYSISADPSDTRSIDNSVDAGCRVDETSAISRNELQDRTVDGLVRINSGVVVHNKYSLRNPSRLPDINSQLSQKILELTQETLHMNYNNSLLSNTSTSQHMNSLKAQPTGQTQMISSKSKFQNCRSIREILQQSVIDYRSNASRLKYLDKFNNNFQVQCNLNQPPSHEYGNIVDLTHEEPESVPDDEFMDINELQAFIPYEAYLKHISDGSQSTTARSSAVDSPKCTAKASVPNLIRIDKNVCEISEIAPSANLNHLPPVEILLNDNIPSNPLLRSQNKNSSSNDLSCKKRNDSSPVEIATSEEVSDSIVKSAGKKFIADRNHASVRTSSEPIEKQVAIENSTVKLDSIGSRKRVDSLKTEKNSESTFEILTSRENNEKIHVTLNESIPEKIREISNDCRVICDKNDDTHVSNLSSKIPNALQKKPSPTKSSLRSFRKEGCSESQIHISCKNIATEDENQVNSNSIREISTTKIFPIDNLKSGETERKSRTKLHEQNTLNKISPAKPTNALTLNSSDSSNKEKTSDEEIDRISPIMLSQIMKKIQLEADLRHEQQCSSKCLLKEDSSLNDGKHLKYSLTNNSNNQRVHEHETSSKEISNEIVLDSVSEVSCPKHYPKSSSKELTEAMLISNTNFSRSSSLTESHCGSSLVRSSAHSANLPDSNITPGNISEDDNTQDEQLIPVTSSQETLFEALHLFKDQNHLPRRKIRKQTEINNLLEELEKLDSYEQNDVSTNNKTDEPFQIEVENQSEETVDQIAKFLGNVMKDTRKPTSSTSNNNCEINPSLVKALVLSINDSENNFQGIEILNIDEPPEELVVYKHGNALQDGSDSSAFLKTRKSDRIRKLKEPCTLSTDMPDEGEACIIISAHNKPTEKKENMISIQNESNDEVMPEKDVNQDLGTNDNEDNLKQTMDDIDESSKEFPVSIYADTIQDRSDLTAVLKTRKSDRILKRKGSSAPSTDEVLPGEVEKFKYSSSNFEPAVKEDSMLNAENDNNNVGTPEKITDVDQTLTLSKDGSENNLEQANDNIDKCSEKLDVSRHEDVLQDGPESIAVLKSRKSDRIRKRKESCTPSTKDVSPGDFKVGEHISIKYGPGEDSITAQNKSDTKNTSKEAKDIGEALSMSTNNIISKVNNIDKFSEKDALQHELELTEILTKRKSDRIRRLKESPAVATVEVLFGELKLCENTNIDNENNDNLTPEKTKHIDQTLVWNGIASKDNLNKKIDNEPFDEIFKEHVNELEGESNSEVLKTRKSDRIRKLKNSVVAKYELPPFELEECENNNTNNEPLEEKCTDKSNKVSHERVKDNTAKNSTSDKEKNTVPIESDFKESNNIVLQEKPNHDIDKVNTIMSKNKDVPQEELNHDTGTSLKNDIMNVNRTIVNTSKKHTTDVEVAIPVNDESTIESNLKQERRSQRVRKCVLPLVKKKTNESNKKIPHSDISTCSKKKRKAHLIISQNSNVSEFCTKKTKDDSENVQHNDISPCSDTVENVEDSIEENTSREKFNDSCHEKLSDADETIEKRFSSVNNLENIQEKVLDNRVASVKTTKKKRRTKKAKKLYFVSTKREFNEMRKPKDSTDKVLDEMEQKFTAQKQLTAKSLSVSEPTDESILTGVEESAVSILPALPVIETLKRSTRRSSVASNHTKIKLNERSKPEDKTTQSLDELYVKSTLCPVLFQEEFIAKSSSVPDESSNSEKILVTPFKDSNDTIVFSSGLQASTTNISKSSKLKASSVIVPASLTVIEGLKKSARRASVASISLPTKSVLTLRQSMRSSVDSNVRSDKEKCVKKSKQGLLVTSKKSKRITSKETLYKQKHISKKKKQKRTRKKSLRLRGLKQREIQMKDEKKNECKNSNTLTKGKSSKPKAELNNNELLPVDFISLEINTVKTEKRGRKRKFDKDTIKKKESGELGNKVRKRNLTKINTELPKSSIKHSKQDIQLRKRKIGDAMNAKKSTLIQKRLRQSVRLQRQSNLRKRNSRNVGVESKDDKSVSIKKMPVKESKSVQKLTNVKLKPNKIIETNHGKKEKKKLKLSKVDHESKVKRDITDMSISIKTETNNVENVRNQGTIIEIHNVIGQLILKKKRDKIKILSKFKEKTEKNKRIDENAQQARGKGRKLKRGRKPKVMSEKSTLKMEYGNNISAPADVYDFHDDLETEVPPIRKQCKLEPGATDTFKQDETFSLEKQIKVPSSSEKLDINSYEINTDKVFTEQHTQVDETITKNQTDYEAPNQFPTQTMKANVPNTFTTKDIREPKKFDSKRDRNLYNIIQNIKTELKEKLTKTEIPKTVHTSPETPTLTGSIKAKATYPVLGDPSTSQETHLPQRRLPEITVESHENEPNLPVDGSSTGEPTPGEFKAALLNSIKIKKEQLRYYDSHRPQPPSEDVKDIKDIKSVLLTCPLCDKVYRSQFRLKQHLRKRHVGQVFDCDCCREYFVDKVAFDDHMRSHDAGIICRHCGDTFPKPAIREHLILHIKEDQRGSVTDACFNKKQTSLLTHYLKKHGFKIQCTQCKDTFCPRSNILRHYLTKHTSDKIFYSCHRCEKRFSLLQNLKRHLAIHEGITYSCNVCDRTYSRLSDYKIHVRMHTGLKFQCPVCLKCASRASYLKKHMIMLHGRDS